MRNGSTAGRCNSFHNFANRRGYAVHRSVVNFSTRLKKKSKCIRERNQAIEDKNVYRDFDKFMRNPLIRRMILNSFNRRVK